MPQDARELARELIAALEVFLRATEPPAPDLPIFLTTEDGRQLRFEDGGLILME